MDLLRQRICITRTVIEAEGAGLEQRHGMPTRIQKV